MSLAVFKQIDEIRKISEVLLPLMVTGDEKELIGEHVRNINGIISELLEVTGAQNIIELSSSFSR